MSENLRTENDPLLTNDATRIRTLQSSESALETPERSSSGTAEKVTNRSIEALHSPNTSSTPISLLLGPPPKDCFSLVYMITFVQGIAVFLPVNMFITIAPSYYSKYWWTLNGTTTTPYETNFMTIISIVSMIPNIFVMILNVVFASAGFMILRVMVSAAMNCLLILIIIVLIIFVKPHQEALAWFYAVTLTIVMLTNFFSGVIESSLFGIVARFPDCYMNVMMDGCNGSGIFVGIFAIITTLVFPNAVETNALLLFSISFVTAFVCLVSIYYLKRSKFYKYYNAVEKESSKKRVSMRKFIRQCKKCFKLCWVQLFNGFYSHFTTHTIFPAMYFETPFLPSKPGDEPILPGNLYALVMYYCNFCLFALIGSMVTRICRYPTAKYLWIYAFARTVIVVFSMFCNYEPTGKKRKWPVLFVNDWWSIISCSVNGITYGHISALVFIYCPACVPRKLQKMNGMLIALTFVLGTIIGLTFTPLLGMIVTEIG